MSRALRIATLGLLASAVACDNAPTTLLVTVTDPATLAPDELRVSIYGERSVLAQDQSHTISGLPGRLVVELPEQNQFVRIGIEARKNAVHVGAGATGIRSQKGRQVSVTLSLEVNLLDGDNDGVANTIDNCPTIPNPDQANADGDTAGDVCDDDTDLAMPSPDLVGVDLVGRDLSVVDLTVPGDLTYLPDLTMAHDLLGQAPPSLFAISPTVAETGHTIVLEGTNFIDPLVVAFPGGVYGNATRLSANRASVVVPAGASAGDLTVSAAGQLSSAVYFRRANFALSPQGFYPEYEQGDLPRHTPRLTEHLHHFVSVNTGRYLYLIGGRSGASRATTQRARINADGTLERFTAGGVSLNVAREGAAVARVGKYVYVLGGANDGDGDLSTIERAEIAADGTLGAFAVQTAHMIVDRDRFAAAVVGNNIYVSGGGDETMERCPLAADGTLGDCVAAGNLAGPTPFFDHHMVVVGGSLYLIGAGTTAILRAPINADGTIGTVVVDGVALSRQAGDGAVVAMGNAVYVLGGQDGSGTHGAVAKATISPATGLLGAFAPIQVGGFSLTLSQKRWGGRAEIIGNYLYLFGGYDTAALDVHEHASINASGDLSDFVAAGRSTTVKHDDTAIALIGDQLYVIGGQTEASVMIARPSVATVAPDGSLGTFAVGGSELSVPRCAHSVVRAGAYLYVIGGRDGDDTLKSVERALVTDDTFGNFEKLEETMVTGRRALTAPRSNAAAIVAGKYLYVIGGSDASGDPVNTVELAELDAAGNLLTDFTVAPMARLYMEGRTGAAAVRVNQRIYVVGGTEDSGSSPDRTEYIETVADGALAATDFLDASNGLSADTSGAAFVVGPYIYALGGAYIVESNRAKLKLDGTFTGPAEDGAELTTWKWFSRYFQTVNNVYCLSGWNDGNVFDAVDRATLR